MFALLVKYIVLPFAIGIYYIAHAIDGADAYTRKFFQLVWCKFGAHQPIERGPHRQECIHCHHHFDVDLMATNLEQSRIGFFEQTLYLGAVGKVDELPWVHHLNEGCGNDLGRTLQVYDNLCAAYQSRAR